MIPLLVALLAPAQAKSSPKPFHLPDAAERTGLPLTDGVGWAAYGFVPRHADAEVFGLAVSHVSGRLTEPACVDGLCLPAGSVLVLTFPDMAVEQAISPEPFEAWGLSWVARVPLQADGGGFWGTLSAPAEVEGLSLRSTAPVQVAVDGGQIVGVLGGCVDAVDAPTLALPAGACVAFERPYRHGELPVLTRINSHELDDPQATVRVGGVTLRAHGYWRDAEAGLTEGVLAAPVTVDGLSFLPGEPFVRSDDGAILKGTLATPAAVAGVSCPVGTQVHLEPERALLTARDTPLSWEGLQLTTIRLYQGAAVDLTLAEPTEWRGLPLEGRVQLRTDGSIEVAQLSRDHVIGVVPVSTKERVSLERDGTVTWATLSDTWVDEGLELPRGTHFAIFEDGHMEGQLPNARGGTVAGQEVPAGATFTLRGERLWVR
ncbi:MAG: hypothetical protein H6739_01965 [Alphaproteobacteria bacterium]|nr:hypothetical protein [Alphaproteobacteria bacterium]